MLSAHLCLGAPPHPTQPSLPHTHPNPHPHLYPRLTGFDGCCNRCPLLQFGFWRVMLDEAQLVAATSSVAAQMTSSLWRRHAWVVTGTPITTRLDEIQVSQPFGLYSGPYCLLPCTCCGGRPSQHQALWNPMQSFLLVCASAHVVCVHV